MLFRIPSQIVRSSSGKPNQRKWGSRTLGEGVWNRVRKPLGWRLTCDRRQALCDRERHCFKMCFLRFCVFLLDFRAYNHGLKGPQKPKTCCDNKLLTILSFTSVFTVGSGIVWQQDLAILSPEGSRDSMFQLRRTRSGNPVEKIKIQSPSLKAREPQFVWFSLPELLLELLISAQSLLHATRSGKIPTPTKIKLALPPPPPPAKKPATLP